MESDPKFYESHGPPVHLDELLNKGITRTAGMLTAMSILISEPLNQRHKLWHPLGKGKVRGRVKFEGNREKDQS